MSVTSGVCHSPASSPNSAPRTRSKPRRWTVAEDKFLTQLVAKFGDKRGPEGHWKEISSRFNARTAKDCRKRWFHSLDPSLRKGRWCESEDRVLLDAYNRLGPAWHDIALLVPGRKDDQCSKRYKEILSPAVRNRLCDWNEEEDRLLVEGVRSFGHSWSAISAQIPGRPPLTCRNRWRVVSKKSQAGVSNEEVASQKITGITVSDRVGSRSVTDNAAVSESTELASESRAAVAYEKDSPDLDVDSNPSISSRSEGRGVDVGTNATFDDMSHTFDSFLQELYGSQNTSAMLPNLSNIAGLPGGSPDPAITLNQNFEESVSLDAQVFDLNRSAERRAELEAETAERGRDTGATQIITDDVASSDRSETHSDWNLEQPGGLDRNLTAFPLSTFSGGIAPTRRPVTGEIHHHHHHHHHYHHHHHHYNHHHHYHN